MTRLRIRFVALLVMLCGCGWMVGQMVQGNHQRCPHGDSVRGARCPAPAYSLTQIFVHVQTLSDGTQIRSRTVTKEAQDAEGRRRTETIPDPNNGFGSQEQVNIIDPVANLNIQLYPKNKVAQVHSYTERSATEPTVADKERDEKLRALFKAIQPTDGSASMGSNLRPHCSNEKVGDEMFEGMAVNVTRMVCTFPAGSQGNDREMRSVTEFWVLADMGITVRSVEDDPRSGHGEMTVEDFKRTPPDPELFRVPEGYQVFDMKR